MPRPRAVPACSQQLPPLCLSWRSAALCLQAGRMQNKLFFPLPHFFLRRPLAARLECEGTMPALCSAERSTIRLGAIHPASPSALLRFLYLAPGGLSRGWSPPSPSLLTFCSGICCFGLSRLFLQLPACRLPAGDSRVSSAPGCSSWKLPLLALSLFN